MNFIEELYYGNINPNEKRYDKCTHYAKTMRKFCDSENKLVKMLKGKPLHLVNDLINASDEIVAITSIENFKLGFRLGVQMICDSLICDDSIFTRCRGFPFNIFPSSFSLSQNLRIVFA